MSICVVSVCVMSICVMPICVHSYPKRNLHTARRQTRMPARRPHKIFAPPIGTATPNAIYTQQGAKPACQQDIHTKFSHLLLAQLPRTQFTHSKPPNPHARKTSTHNFRSSYWHSYPERNLPTARRQTRMPAGHQRKLSQLLLAQLPRTQFTQSKAPNPNASDTSTQNFRSSIGTKSHACHAKAAAERQGPSDAKAYIRPPAMPTSPTPATQKQRQSGGAQTTPKRTSHPLLRHQVPRLPHKSSGTAAEPKRRQSVHQTSCSATKPHACHTKHRQSVHQTPCRRSKPHACHAKAAAEQRRPRSAKAYIRPPAVQPVPRLPRESSGSAAETKERQSVHQTPCSAASPTPATRKQRQRSGDQGAPKRTSDPLQRSKSHACHAKAATDSGDQGAPKRTSDPLQCSKSHACHAKAAAEQRRPRSAKAYIRPPAGAPSPTPATRKQGQSSGDQGAPKRTSDPLQCSKSHACHESSGSAAETKERQSVHQTPCSAANPTPATRKQRQSSGDQGAPKRTSDPLQRSKPHACHAKAAAEPNDAKAYIRPPAAPASPTPATQKQRQSGGAQTTPKRTSDPLQRQQAPRLPRKSSGRAAEPKRRQSVHQTPCSATKSHAYHAKVQRPPRHV